MTKKLLNKFYLSLVLFIFPSTLFAADNWQMGFNESVTSVMDDIVHLHDRILLPIIVAISVFVLFLLLYSVIRFRASKNPVPSKTSHNTFIEILWTVIPCLILIVIAVPSFRLLYKQDVIPKADVTIRSESTRLNSSHSDRSRMPSSA
jgi:cytochrome c oxidase subunit 2